MSKRQIRRGATIVREELRRMEQAMKRGEWEWVLIHAQQAAGMAATLEYDVETHIDPSTGGGF